MKRTITILTFGILLALLFRAAPWKSDVSSIEKSPSAKKPKIRPAILSPQPTTDFYINRSALPNWVERKISDSGKYPYTNIPALSKDREKTTYDNLIQHIDAETLREYEGSYTMDEMRGIGNDPVSMKLQSSWITKGSNTPQAGLNVRLNSLTGQYEIMGGELYLPRSGIGLSCEPDKDTGETKTFLNLKREF